MQVFQTAGDPPRKGRINFAINGWTKNKRVALRNNVTANRSGKKYPPKEGRGPRG
jgi:hypothetical protein